jgi:hypothetical protein
VRRTRRAPKPRAQPVRRKAAPVEAQAPPPEASQASVPEGSQAKPGSEPAPV